MVLLSDVFGVPSELVTNIATPAMMIICLVGAVRYLQQRNDELVNKLEASHSDRESKLLEVIKETHAQHEDCNQRYFELATKWSESANNLSNVIEKLGYKIETFK